MIKKKILRSLGFGKILKEEKTAVELFFVIF